MQYTNSTKPCCFEEWTTANGTQNMFVKSFTETDAFKNIYVGGTTINGSGDYDILLTKYDPRGVLLWTQQYAGAGNGDDGASANCFGDSGNVYITGTVYTSTNNLNDCVVLKYDKNGNLKWAQTFNGTASNLDAGTDICIDANYNVYVGGTCTQTGTYQDFLVIKYDKNGTLLWNNSYNNSSVNMMDISNKISLNDGVVIVAGGTQTNPTKWEYAITKFNQTTGAFNSVTTTNSSGNGIDKVTDLVTDQDGNIYVTGGIVNTGTGYDYHTVKLDSNLVVQWAATYNGNDSLDDMAQAVKIDDAGHVFVTGYSTTANQGTDIVTIRYSSTGVQQGMHTYNDTDNGDDGGEEMLIDDSGNVYVTGYAFNGSNLDYHTFKLQSNATLIWEIDYNGLYNNDDKAMDMCLDDDGDLIVVGQCDDGDSLSYITIKYIERDIIMPPDTEAVSSMSYLENRGQIVDTSQSQIPGLRFYANNASPALFFFDNTISYLLTDSNETTGLFDAVRVDQAFIESSSKAKVYPLNKKDILTNYYLAHIPKGRERIGNYSQLVFANLYNNIDLLYSSNNKGPKSYYIIKQGGLPSDIKFSFYGSDSIYVNNDSDLVVQTSLSNIILPQPIAYQIDANGNKVTISWQPQYSISGNSVNFTIGSYNSALSLVFEIRHATATPPPIAPEGNLMYCTSWGTGRNEIINDIAVDDITNFTYLVGYTNSDNLPVSPGAYSYQAQSDAYVVSLMPNTDIMFETYYGGTSMENPTSIAIHKENSPLGGSYTYIFISGYTYSPDIPHLQVTSTNGYGTNSYLDSSLGGSEDIFISRFHRDGVCDWSTYYGGNTDSLNFREESWDMVITYNSLNKMELFIVGNGNIHTPLIYTQNEYHSTDINSFGLILKFDFTLNPVWVTRFPVLQIYGIDAFRYSNGVSTISITGITNNNNLPIESNDLNYPNTAICQGYDAFVTSFSSSNQIILAEYIGGSNYDCSRSISVNEDNIVISGTTKSINFLCKRQQPYISNDFFVSTLTSNSGDAFITKISRDNNGTLQTGKIVWSTYYGGGGYDESWSIDMDDESNIVIHGLTNSGDNSLTIPHPWQNPLGTYNHIDKFGNNEWDAFVSYFSNDTRLIWATYFGSDPDDIARTCKINNNKLFIAGAHFWNSSYSSSNTRLHFYRDLSATYNFDFFKYGVFPYPWNWSNGYLARFNLPEIPQGVNIEEIENSKILIYPNPTNNYINIKTLNNLNIVRVETYNIIGDLVVVKFINEKTNKCILNISSLKQAVYYVFVYSDNGKVFSKRIVKIKN